MLQENQSTGYGHLTCSATQTSYTIETVHLHVTNNKGAATRSFFSALVVRIFISSNDDGQPSCVLVGIFFSDLNGYAAGRKSPNAPLIGNQLLRLSAGKYNFCHTVRNPGSETCWL